MSSFFGNRRPASGLSGQPPGSFNDPSFGDTDTQASSNAGTWQGEAAQQEEMDARAKTSGYPGHQQAPPAYPQEQYSGQTSHLSVPPGSNQYAASSAYNQYTGPGADSSLLAPNSLTRSDTVASNFTQQSAAASLSEMSQPGMPTDGAVWKLGRHDPVLPDYRGIPVKPNTTIYQPGEANGGVWHDDWKVQTKNKQQKAFVDTWDNLAGQCECGFGRGLPVQKNLCPKFYQDHLNNAREGIRILKQQFFNKRDKVTVAAWDQVLDSGDTFVSGKELDAVDQGDENKLWDAPMELEEVSGLSFRSKDRAAKKRNDEAQSYNARLLQDQKRILTELNRPS